MKRKSLLVFIALAIICAVSVITYFKPSGEDLSRDSVSATQIDTESANNDHITSKKRVGSGWVEKEAKAIHAVASNLDVNVLKVSLTAYSNAKQKGLVEEPLITIVDYSKPSSQRRLWVIDLDHNKVLFNTYVAHGKNSGSAETTSFSNSPRSLKSSMGVFLTDETYSGHNGISLRVKGLEHNVNDNAYSRSIVFHGAAYVSADIAKARGMLGRSWGCFAVAKNTIAPIINTIKHKTLVIAYYPDKHWLNTSRFLR